MPDSGELSTKSILINRYSLYSSWGGGGSCPQRASLSTGIVCTLVGGGAGELSTKSILINRYSVYSSWGGGGGVVHKEHPYQQV